MNKIPPMQQPPKQQIQVDPAQTTSIDCIKCGNQTFISAVLLRKVSKLLSPDGDEKILPIPTFVCNGCGYVLEDTLPQFIIDEAKSKQEEPKYPPFTLIKD